MPIVGCPPLKLTHANITYSDPVGASVGSTATLYCDSAYTLTGPKTLTCVNNVTYGVFWMPNVNESYCVGIHKSINNFQKWTNDSVCVIFQ